MPGKLGLVYTEETHNLTEVEAIGNMQVSFSAYCMSGWVGSEVCQCGRCYDRRMGTIDPKQRIWTN